MPRNGYRITEMVLHARIPVISFDVRVVVPPTRQKFMWVKCDLTAYRPFPIVNSEMIQQYVEWDTSGHLKQLLMLVKLFAKHQAIGNAGNGYLSSYTWVLLTLHVLIRDGLLPVLEVDTSRKHTFRLCPSQLTVRPSIDEVDVPLLFYRVLMYYTTEYDVLNGVVTLRGHGEVSGWPPHRPLESDLNSPRLPVRVYGRGIIDGGLALRYISSCCRHSPMSITNVNVWCAGPLRAGRYSLLA